MQVRSLSSSEMPAAPAGGSREKILDAAKDFEALLVTQLVRAARAGEGWLGAEAESAASPALEFAEEQLAGAISAGGGLGLARMISTALESQTPRLPRGPR